MRMSGILEIGVRSLLAYQYALDITGQNIANDQTQYYSRRVVEFQDDGMNSGVSIGDVRRIFDSVADDQLKNSITDLSKSTQYADQLSSLEIEFGGDLSSKTDIGKYLNDALDSIRNLNGNASSMQNRATFLNALMNLSSKFNSLSSSLQKQGSDTNRSLLDQIQKTNQDISQLADLNQKLLHASDSEKNDLLDKQEKIKEDLAQYINFKTSTDQNGLLNLTLDNGASLLFGTKANSIALQNSQTQTNQMSIILTDGTFNLDVTSQISSGSISGLLEYSQKDIPNATQLLNRLSVVISSALNEQNKLGLDLNGKLGSNIFSDINSPSLMAQRFSSGLNNTGSANLSVQISDATQLSGSNYQLVVDAPGHYNLVRGSDQKIVSSGNLGALPQTISADGVSIQLSSGTLNVGDQYTISPTAGAAQGMKLNIQDASQLALALPVLADSSTQNQGKGVISVDGISNIQGSIFQGNQQLTPPLKIHFTSDTQYEILNATDSSVIASGLTYDPSQPNSIFPTPQGFDPGIRISLSGAIHAGDEFNISYNTNPSNDNRNGQFLEKLFGTPLIDQKNNTFLGEFRSILSGISSKTGDTKANMEADKIVFSNARDRRSNVSGVIVAEETMNLAKYQQAYQASAQLLQTAKNIFETIISLARS